MSDNNSRSAIPVIVKTRLWMASAGRCQFTGCNEALWKHNLTMDQMNKAYIAHIYAYSPNGSRYDNILSPQLETDFSNLMLVCDACHRIIDDKSRENEYPAPRLIKMKKEHEDRIELLTSIKPEKRSHIILFGTKVGEHNSPLNYINARNAIIPNYYPATDRAIELGLKNSSFEDADDSYWNLESENLSNLFKKHLEFTKEQHEVQHYSIFGIAPQPLLIKLGTLLNDMYPAEIYQFQREPSAWLWLDEDDDVHHNIIESSGAGSVVALKFELSATITDDRITDVLGKDVEIWSLTIKSPNNNYLKSKKHLQDFREKMRNVFDLIKAKHGQNAELHIFPAMPIAVAIELGRIWMPKADLPMIIYDQNRKRNGFFKTIEIK